MTVSGKGKQDESIQNSISISNESKLDGNGLNNIAVSECKLDRDIQENATISSESKQDGSAEENISLSDENDEGKVENHMTLSDSKQEESRIVQYVAGFTCELLIKFIKIHF